MKIGDIFGKFNPSEGSIYQREGDKKLKGGVRAAGFRPEGRGVREAGSRTESGLGKPFFKPANFAA